MSFVSDRWNTMIPWHVFIGFAEFQWIPSINDFRLFRRIEKLSSTRFHHLKSFGFERIRWHPLSGQILFHDCISVIDSRFSALIEDFVICCHQVTKLFFSRYCCDSASSARSPRNLGSLADFIISVFREVSINTVFPACHFRRTFRVWVMGSVCECCTSVSSRLSVHSSSHSGRSRNRFVAAWM